LRAGLTRSIAHHSMDIEAPRFDADAAQRGLVEYQEHCRRCHGAPGVAPDEFALGMAPLPTNLVFAAQTSTPEQIYWTIKHGIKMTGMPAWEYRLDDASLWDITAFVSTALPAMSPAEYRVRVGGLDRGLDLDTEPATGPLTTSLESRLDPGRGAAEANRRAAALRPPPAAAVNAAFDGYGAVPRLYGYAASPPVLGDPRRGARAIPQYGCTTCHSIPGILGRPVKVGPPLRGVARRNYLGGVLPNTPDAMVRWLLDPQAADPDSAMPALGLTPADAADIAAYLYTLDKE
jgi:mono/diheme cytochrome c family protein